MKMDYKLSTSPPGALTLDSALAMVRPFWSILDSPLSAVNKTCWQWISLAGVTDGYAVCAGRGDQSGRRSCGRRRRWKDVLPCVFVDVVSTHHDDQTPTHIQNTCTWTASLLSARHTDKQYQ